MHKWVKLPLTGDITCDPTLCVDVVVQIYTTNNARVLFNNVIQSHGLEIRKCF